MSKICKFCGEPVVVNKNNYEVFEGMHWICFHLNFEHNGYDPDEPCADPSCPWNRIVNRNFSKYEKANHNIKIISIDKNRSIEMIFIEAENVHHLPSLSAQVKLLGDISGSISKNVWFDIESIITFIDSLCSLKEAETGKAVLQSINLEEFILEIEIINGDLVLKYKNGFSEYLVNRRSASLITSEFKIGIQDLKKIISEFSKIKDNIGGL